MPDAAVLPIGDARRDRHRHVVDAASRPLQSIRIVIADGQPLVCAGLRALLEAEDDVSVVGEAGDAAEATAMALQARPDVLLLDSELPGVDGVDLAQLVDGVHILILTAPETEDGFLPAIRAGVKGVLLKDGRIDQLGDAVRAVARGDAALAPSVARRLLAEVAAQPDARRHTHHQLDELTAREREVVALVGAGLSNGEIAEHLVVSPATAKTHVSRALCKLQARDRAQLVRFAYETGLVVPRQRGSALPSTATFAAA
jgi:DNA-binding NarL/FixJ family response regulator